MDQLSGGGPTPAQLLAKLREGCGILVKSPEFMLTNVTPRGYSDNNMPDPPRLAVCLPGEPCGYSATCGHWRSVLWSMGHYIVCEDRSVRRGHLLIVGWPWLVNVKFVEQPVVGPFTPIRTWPFDPVLAKRADVVEPETREELEKLKPAERRRLAQLSGVRFRVAQLCHPGICGFVGRPAADLERCLKEPGPNSCRSLFPACDPRIPNSVNYCGDQPADIHDAGVLVLWAEGALVTRAKGARILREGKRSWVALKAKTKLQSGDFIHVPLHATLQIRSGKKTFGPDKSLYREPVEGIEGHVIAITGPSAGRLLARRPALKNALSPAALRKGIEAGEYDGRPITKRDWQRIIGYGARPGSRITPTLDQIQKINEDFESLHFPPESGLAPDGSDLPSKPE